MGTSFPPTIFRFFESHFWLAFDSRNFKITLQLYPSIFNQITLDYTHPICWKKKKNTGILDTRILSPKFIIYNLFKTRKTAQSPEREREKGSKLIETLTVHRERISSLDEQSVEARLSRGGNQSVLEAAVEAVAAARVNHRRINTEMGRVHAIPRPASPAFIVRVSTHPRGPLRTRHLDIYTTPISPENYSTTS